MSSVCCSLCCAEAFHFDVKVFVFAFVSFDLGVIGTQALGASAAAFLGAPAGNYIRSEVTGTLTWMLMSQAVV